MISDQNLQTEMKHNRSYGEEQFGMLWAERAILGPKLLLCDRF